MPTGSTPGAIGGNAQKTGIPREPASVRNSSMYRRDAAVQLQSFGNITGFDGSTAPS